MKLILYDKLRCPVPGIKRKEISDPVLPRKHREFIHRSEKERRRFVVQFLVHHLNWKPVPERACLPRAIKGKVIPSVHLVAESAADFFIPVPFLCHAGSAPWTFQDLKLIVRVLCIFQIVGGCLAKFFQILFCPVISVRRVLPSDPQSYGDRNRSECVMPVHGVS